MNHGTFYACYPARGIAIANSENLTLVILSEAPAEFAGAESQDPCDAGIVNAAPGHFNEGSRPSRRPSTVDPEDGHD